MQHPLISGLDTLKDLELEERITELTKKYFKANSVDMQQQIVVILEMYKEELNSRRRKSWEEQQNRRDKGLDDLINVD